MFVFNNILSLSGTAKLIPRFKNGKKVTKYKKMTVHLGQRMGNITKILFHFILISFLNQCYKKKRQDQTLQIIVQD